MKNISYTVESLNYKDYEKLLSDSKKKDEKLIYALKRFGFTEKYINESLENNYSNHCTATYYLF